MWGLIDALGRLNLTDEERLTTFMTLTIASSVILLLIFPDFSY
jgi:hypothetical protein